MSENPIGDSLLTIIEVVVGIILLTFMIPGALLFFGQTECSGCSELTSVFLFVVFPLAAVFGIFYFIMMKFTRK